MMREARASYNVTKSFSFSAQAIVAILIPRVLVVRWA